MESGTGTMLRSTRDRITEAVEAGATLDEVEREVIEPRPLPREARAALWLYAWVAEERATVGAPPPAARRIG